jgi:hypothetical protein
MLTQDDDHRLELRHGRQLEANQIGVSELAHGQQRGMATIDLLALVVLAGEEGAGDAFCSIVLSPTQK